MAPGAPADDAPVHSAGRVGWLLEHTGNRFVLLLFADDAAHPTAAQREAIAGLATDRIPVQVLIVVRRGAHGTGGADVIVDHEGLVARRFDARSGTAYLLRPDQHVAARWRGFDAAAVRTAVARATCNLRESAPCNT